MIALHRNRWVRIQGLALVMFIMSQIDRSNIALAFPGMRADLGLSATAIGFATGGQHQSDGRSGSRHEVRLLAEPALGKQQVEQALAAWNAIDGGDGLAAALQLLAR